MGIPGETTDQSIIWVPGEDYGVNSSGAPAVVPSGTDQTASPSYVDDAIDSVEASLAALRAELSASGYLPPF